MVPTSDLAAATSATYGGRFDVRLVGVACEMVLVDVASMYPTMFSLLGLTAVYACGRFDVIDRDPDDLLTVLRNPDRWLDLSTWRGWAMTFVVLRPHGEALPVSAQWDGTFGLTVAPVDLHGGDGCWAWPDVAAAVAEGADPDQLDLLRVLTIVPVGTQPGLHPLRLPTGRLVDLTIEDLGQVLIEERAAANRSGLAWLAALVKAVANALCYGGLARTDPHTMDVPTETIGHGLDGQPFTVLTRYPETPGPHQFLPAAAAVCAGARLIMALAQAAITARGGVVAAMHADSLTVPCNLHGGWLHVPDDDAPVRVLSVAQLTEILDQFGSLRVHFKWQVPATDPPTAGLVVAVNRVVFGRRTGSGGWVIVRSSDSGLGGHLADPSDQPRARQDDGRWSWAADAEAALLSGSGEQWAGRGLTVDDTALPAWAVRPVVRRYTASSYTRLKQLYADSGDPTVGPFARYLRAGPGLPGGPVAVGPWPNAADWHQADWRYHGHQIGIDTRSPSGQLTPLTAPRPGIRVAVESIHTYLLGWANPHDPRTTGHRRGRRTPRPVHSVGCELVGRDTTELLTTDHDPTTSAGHTTLVYGTDDTATNQLRQMAVDRGLRTVSRAADLPYETVRAWAHGAATRPRYLAAIINALDRPAGPAEQPACTLPGCSRPARSRSPWCTDAHKKAGARRRQRDEQP